MANGKPGAPKGGKMARMTVAQAVAAVRAGKVLAMPAMIDLLQDAMHWFWVAQERAMADESHLEALIGRRNEALRVAEACAPYMHPRMSSVDFKAEITEIQSVIRAPEIAKTADNWSEANKGMGVHLIDVTPEKKSNKLDSNGSNGKSN
jgi:hypothetical protein